MVNELQKTPNQSLIILYFKKTEGIILKNKHHTLFDLTKMTVEGVRDELSEDLRDFLRRNSIKFYTSKNFKSMTPPRFKKLLSI